MALRICLLMLPELEFTVKNDGRFTTQHALRANTVLTANQIEALLKANRQRNKILTSGSQSPGKNERRN